MGIQLRKQDWGLSVTCAEELRVVYWIVLGSRKSEHADTDVCP